MTQSDPYPTTGNIWCPYGSESQSGIEPALAVLLAPEAFITFIGASVNPVLGAVIAGLALGSIAVGALCANPPVESGPYDPSWLYPQNLFTGIPALVKWLTNQAYIYAWNQDCQCSPPDITAELSALTGAFNTGAWQSSPTISAFWLEAPSIASWRWVGDLDQSSGTNCVELAAYQGAGPAGPVGNELWNTTLDPTQSAPSARHWDSGDQSPDFGSGGSVELLLSAMNCPGNSVAVHGTWQLYFKVSSAQADPPRPPTLPQGLPQPDGVITDPSLIPPPPAETTAAQACSLLEALAPSSFTPGAATAVSGSGNYAIPKCIALLLVLSALDPSASEEFGPPPYLYGAGNWEIGDALGATRSSQFTRLETIVVPLSAVDTLLSYVVYGTTVLTITPLVGPC